MVEPVLLLVEDDPVARQSLVRMTRARGYPVRVAFSPAEALHMLDDVAVVVSGFRMAGMNGVEFLRCARAAQPRAACYLVTGSLGIVNVRRAVLDGTAMAAFARPWDEELLLFAVRRASTSTGVAQSTGPRCRAITNFCPWATYRPWAGRSVSSVRVNTGPWPKEATMPKELRIGARLTSGFGIVRGLSLSMSTVTFWTVNELQVSRDDDPGMDLFPERAVTNAQVHPVDGVHRFNAEQQLSRTVVFFRNRARQGGDVARARQPVMAAQGAGNSSVQPALAAA